MCYYYILHTESQKQATVDLAKEYTCPEGLLVVNGAPNHNQSVAAVADKPLKHSELQGKPQTELPASYNCAPSGWAHPYKGVPGTMFWPMGWDLSHPIRTP